MSFCLSLINCSFWHIKFKLFLTIVLFFLSLLEQNPAVRAVAATAVAAAVVGLFRLHLGGHGLDVVTHLQVRVPETREHRINGGQCLNITEVTGLLEN